MEEKLYPLVYKGRVFKEEDCKDIFTLFYHSKDSIQSDGSVYVADGLSITPDGEWLGE